MKETQNKVFVTISAFLRKDTGIVILQSKSFKSLEAAVGSMTLDYFSAIRSREGNGYKIESRLRNNSAELISDNEELHWEVKENELN